MQFIRKNSIPILLLLFFIANLLLRIFEISKLPPSLNWDEISLGYNSFSILNTGKDEWGSIFPLIFRAYGDYKLPLYIYLSTPFIYLFGLNAFSVRLLSAVAGSLLPLVLFFTTKTIFSKEKDSSHIAVTVLLLSSFSPWSIFLSRIALEANLFLLVVSLSILYLMLKKPYLSGFFFGLSLFTYNSSRVLLPFYLVLLFTYFLKTKPKLKFNLLKMAPFFFFIILFITQTFQESGQARYKWVTLLDQGSINKINELRQNSLIPNQLLNRVVFNKVTYFTVTAAQNYVKHFYPNYLFMNGGNHSQFSIPNYYLISPLFIPFYYFALFWFFYKLFRKKLSLNEFFLLSFILISPIPSAVTRDAPHVLRSILFLPLSSILIIIGVFEIFKKFIKPTLTILLLVGISISTLISFYVRYQKYSIQYSQSWQAGYSQLVSSLKSKYSKYDTIYITKRYGEPHEFLLFYWPWPASDYQNSSSKKWDYHADWYWINAFDKFVFVNDWDIKNLKPAASNYLLVSSQESALPKATPTEVIYFNDGSVAFNIYEKIEK